MDSFAAGPFAYEAVRRAGVGRQVWAVSYGYKFLGESAVKADADRQTIIAALSGHRYQFTVAHREEHEPDTVYLVDSETGDEIGSFCSDSMCDMTPGLIDDRAKYWLCSSDRRYSRALESLTEFASVAAVFSAPWMSWIAALLPDDVLTNDSEAWRAPTAWEIRHVVGKDSFTGTPGALAASYVGVTAQNFRKYTAQDGARTRQNMSYAMWHLLLQKLGVKRA